MYGSGTFIKKYYLYVPKTFGMDTNGLTKLGAYFKKKSVNKSSIARKTGLHKNRLTVLSKNPSARLLADELYLIALAIGVKPCELLDFLYKDNDGSPSTD